MLLLCVSLAHAAEPNFAVQPYGWVRTGYAWRQDDAALISDTDGFSVAARMGLQAVSEPIRLRARIEVDLQPEPVLRDAFLNWSPHAAFSLNLGQLKVPFLQAQLGSELRRQLPGTSPLEAAIPINRDMGALAEGRLPVGGKVRGTLSAGLFNGEGANRLENVNDRYLSVLRLQITPLGARERPMEGTQREPYLGFFGGWLYNYTGEDETAAEANTYTGGLQFSVAWFSFQAEYADYGVVYAAPEVEDFHSLGGYGQFGFFIPAPWLVQHIEVVGRGSYTEPNSAFADELDQREAVAVEAGLNLYVPEAPKFMHDVKVQAAWRHPIELEGGSVDDDRVDIIVSAGF